MYIHVITFTLKYIQKWFEHSLIIIFITHIIQVKQLLKMQIDYFFCICKAMLPSDAWLLSVVSVRTGICSVCVMYYIMSIRLCAEDEMRTKLCCHHNVPKF